MEQIEKIDVTFKDIESSELRVLANADKMHAFIYELIDQFRATVKHSGYSGEVLDAVEEMNKELLEQLADHNLCDLFDI